MFLDKHLGRIFNSQQIKNRGNANARARAKRLAVKLGVTIDIVPRCSGGGYWLNNTGRDDENFCSDWLEVEDKLKDLS